MTDYTELDRLAEELTARVNIDIVGTTRYRNTKGQLHRVYGPAVIYPDGTEFWMQNNNYHRLDGPSRIWSDGNRYWYIDGIQYTEEEFNAHPLVIEYAKSKQQQ